MAGEQTAAGVTEERLERALAYAAYLVLRYGEKIVPIFDRLERELEACRHNRSPMVRAKAILDHYTIPVGTEKAIR